MMPARLGHYLLLEQLHLGAFAEVYLGRTRSLPGMEQLVAIKRIHPLVSADEDFREAFLDEARIAAQLRHANIAQVLEVGEEQGTYFIAMEYVSGRPLRALLDRCTRQGETLPSPQAAWLVSRICDGLEHAHGKSDVEGVPLGIVHRAISPENVLVSFDGEVKLIDFGLAKAANSTQHTSAGTLKGKLGYLSPEQVLGRPVDRRTDLFSVGVLLFEMLTGMRLFGAPNEADTLQMVGDAQVPPPRSLNPAIPEGLELVVLKALAREPAERFQSASEFAAALGPFTLSEAGTFSAADLAKGMHRDFSDAFAEETERLRRLARVRELPLPGAVPAMGAPAPNAAVAPPAVAPIATPAQGSAAGLRPVDPDRLSDVDSGTKDDAAAPSSLAAASASAPPMVAPADAASSASSALAASLFGDEDGPDPVAPPAASAVASTPSSAAGSTPAFGVSAQAPAALEVDPFSLSEGLPRAFGDEDEDDDPEDRTQVLSPDVMEATLESAATGSTGARALPLGAPSNGGEPGRDWRSATQPFAGSASPPPDTATPPRPSGARVTSTQSRLAPPQAPPGSPAGPSERPPAESPPRRTTELPTRNAQAAASQVRRPTKLASPQVAQRPASGGHPALPREPRPSNASRPALAGAGRSETPATIDPPFPDRSHPAFAAAARASDPTRPSNGSRAALTSSEVVILASNDQPPAGERRPGGGGPQASPGARQSPVPPKAGERDPRSLEALVSEPAPSGARPSPVPRGAAVRPPPGAARSQPSGDRPSRTATLARRPELDREDLETPEVTDPALALPRVTLAVAPPGPETESPRAAAVRTLTRAWPIAAAAAVLLFLGLWLLLRAPDGSPVIVRVSPAEGAIVTLGGRQVQSGRTERIPPGEYELVAVAEGYVRHSQRITVFEDAPEAVYPILLEREAPRQPVPPPAEKSTPAAPREFTATFVSGVQGVEIFVEGQSIGRTPEAKATLALGRAYHYEARAEGYRKAEGTFGSYGDPAVTVELALEKLPEATPARQSRPARGVGHLVCTSNPQGAEIFIDGKPTGRRTPVPATDPIELPPGKHRVLFEIAGVVSEVKTITIEKDKTVTLQGVPVDRDRDL